MLGGDSATRGFVLAQTQANAETLKEIDALFAQLELEGDFVGFADTVADESIDGVFGGGGV